MELKDLLADLHLTVAQTLLDRIKSGEATATDLNVARQFLKDNGIDSIPMANAPMHKLASLVPFRDPEEPIAKAGN